VRKWDSRGGALKKDKDEIKVEVGLRILRINYVIFLRCRF